MAIFLDSNVVLYALGDDQRRRGMACELLARQPTISTQVVNECCHHCDESSNSPPWTLPASWRMFSR